MGQTFLAFSEYLNFTLPKLKFSNSGQNRSCIKIINAILKCIQPYFALLLHLHFVGTEVSLIFKNPFKILNKLKPVSLSIK